jgi:hypothetical protein
MVVNVDIKFKENQIVYFITDLDNKIKEWLNSEYDKNKLIKVDYIGGKITEIHIKENKIYYNIQTYSLTGYKDKIIEYIPQKYVFETKEEVEKGIKCHLIAYLDEVIENSKRFIANIEKYKEKIKND